MRKQMWKLLQYFGMHMCGAFDMLRNVVPIFKGGFLLRVLSGCLLHS